MTRPAKRRESSGVVANVRRRPLSLAVLLNDFHKLLFCERHPAPESHVWPAVLLAQMTESGERQAEALCGLELGDQFHGPHPSPSSPVRSTYAAVFLLAQAGSSRGAPSLQCAQLSSTSGPLPCSPRTGPQRDGRGTRLRCRWDSALPPEMGTDRSPESVLPRPCQSATSPQNSNSRPSAPIVVHHVCAGQPLFVVSSHWHPFPWLPSQNYR